MFSSFSNVSRSAHTLQVLEYSLFQPGVFLNYLSFPYPSTKHMHIFNLQWDLQNRRAIVPANVDFPVTLTTVQDMAKVVAEAIDYKAEWPERGGISGTRTTNSELIKLAESIRGLALSNNWSVACHQYLCARTKVDRKNEMCRKGGGTRTRYFLNLGCSSPMLGRACR